MSVGGGMVAAGKEGGCDCSQGAVAGVSAGVGAHHTGDELM